MRLLASVIMRPLQPKRVFCSFLFLLSLLLTQRVLTLQEMPGVSITLVISGHWRCNRRLWPLKWLQGPSLMKSKQTAVGNLTGGGRPPVTGFYRNLWMHCYFLVTSTWQLPKGSSSIYSCISLDWFTINSLFGKEIAVGLGLGLVRKIGVECF